MGPGASGFLPPGICQAPVRESKRGFENIGCPLASKKKYIGYTLAVSGMRSAEPLPSSLRGTVTAPKSTDSTRVPPVQPRASGKPRGRLEAGEARGGRGAEK